MKAFWRIFEYVWPQWPRIIVVVLSALILSSLLSLSFMTVIPLLKVMMGDEGIHGWVERKICSGRYGISFASSDGLGEVEAADALVVTSLKENGLAQKAGLEKFDVITGINELRPEQEGQNVSRAKLLEALATAPVNSKLAIHLLRRSGEGVGRSELTLNAGSKPFYVNSLEKLINTLPRENTPENKKRTVTYIIMLIGVVTVLRCLAKFTQEYMTQKVVQVGINRLREDTFAHALEMPVEFFANERPSDTVSRIVRDSDVMGKAIKVMLGKALREPLNALFMVILAMWLNWELTAIFLLGAPFVLGLVIVLGRKMKRATRKSLVAGSQMLAKLQEVMSSLRVVKVYNRRDYEHENFKTINSRLLKQQLKISKVDAATMPVMEIFGMAAGSAALIFGAYWITSGKMDGPEEFFGLLILLGVAAESVRKTSDVWNRIQEANAAAERVFAIMDSPVEHEAAHAIELPPVKKSIEFADVMFTYPGASQPALKGINLVVPAGHNIALVGPNGSGKTTLANLIPRFYDPDSGRILIDGKDIREAKLRNLRSQIGMVTQNVITFNDTISANIAYGKPGATREEIIDAARRSFAHEFVAPLPKGYDTIIGEDNTGLSGGQLQRIVIARAILKNPAILIFDEATSQVDADSEGKIHSAIEEIMRDRTCFIIAHRFSTVITADVIVVMDGGRIVAQGQHNELMKTCPLYQSLYEIQLVKA
ncbi:MAG: ATP-binding cassette domain-containing protein, partial [Sedimentisphaerales bacterium]|nr:ATP-binding cassette domain-containing protein [Sedimentisphaerales bacterium]